MTINYNEIIQACEVLARQEDLSLCINESLKGAGMAGLAALLFGVLLGPMGIAFGGAVGGLAGAKYAQNYVPLWRVITELREEEKERLGIHMTRIVQSLEVTDAIVLMSLISNPDSIARTAMLRGLQSFFGLSLTN